MTTGSVVDQLTIDTEPRNTSARFDDGWISVMIDSKLIVDPEVHSRNVDVDVIEGVVTLSGIVETDIARSEAEQLASSSPSSPRRLGWPSSVAELSHSPSASRAPSTPETRQKLTH